MYQTIVLGLGFLLLFGAAYLIKNTDNAGLIMSTISKTEKATTTDASFAERKIEGVYLCDSDTGCPDPAALRITGEGEVRMDITYQDGAEVLKELGTWKNEKDGSAMILLTGTDSGIYPTPRAILVKYVSSSSLSGITFDPRAYEGWTRPVFRRQASEIE